MNIITWVAPRLRFYRIKLFNSFRKVESVADFFWVLSTIFNYLNLNLKNKVGVFFPFSLGKPVDELRDPLGLLTLKALEERFEPIKITIKNEPQRLNFMVPTVNPELIFGGYIGLFNYMAALLEHGYELRIFVCEDVLPLTSIVEKKMGADNVVTQVLKRCELRECLDREIEQVVGKDDVFVGYSWMTMRLAKQAADHCNGKRPIFFIQEFEPIFHHYDSVRFFAEETYSFEHTAVFNSPQLKRFFEQKKLGVFIDEKPKYCVFKHAIADIAQPDFSNRETSSKKRLLVYARPEKHAGRNLFEVSIMLIKRAINEGVLKTNDWEFYGIGSLGAAKDMELAEGAKLKLIPRMSFKEYTESLMNYDVGISLMYAPHPSVPPLEMASAGMLAVTTCFENRSPDEMRKMSSNIIAAEHTMDSLMAALAEAVTKSNDFSYRKSGANINWSTSWSESFNHNFLETFDSLLEN
ncbi:hypothetical protein DIT71_16950 [Marinobacter vulgaris]|uniref:Glycosyl transferase family 1 domain-containing protein n=1 Tax=Marinobacter vulgaris TaxID=1928331 RepID=A0A2V3ZJ04_9GAMM|nr:hypothetical protein [Marinobacter vulgaris]PXX88877.1 hypothetical protein DIT71_16950 [Marinobacter vulgaris]TSJ66692.1 hypothetical protein FPC41_17135 [Marinobacter vulgaris]